MATSEKDDTIGRNKSTRGEILSWFDSLNIRKAILWFSLFGVFIFFNALFGRFLWDDEIQIVQTPYTYSIKNIPLIFSVGQLNIFYRPVFLSYLTIIHWLFGLNVFFFHIFQVLIHIANTILIFSLFTKFLHKRISFFLALLFLIHPMNVEGVAYISSVSDPLFVFFGLVAFHIMMKEKITVYSLLAASFLMLLSILTKEAGFLLLLMILVGRFMFQKKNKINITISAVFTLIPLAIYFFLRLVIAHTFFTRVHFTPIAQASLYERLVTIPKIIFFYASTFFVPIKLSVAQHWLTKSLNWTDFYIPFVFDIIFFIVLFIVGVTLYRRNKKAFSVFFFFLIWFIAGMGFYLQIIPLDMTVAERWFYLPMIGLLGILGVIIENLKISTQKGKLFASLAMIAVVLIFSIRTMIRNANWQDAYALFSHDILITKDSFDIENNYSLELAKLGKYDEALAHAEKAIYLAPKHSATWANAGTIYMSKKEYQKAVSYFLKALEIDGGNYAAFYNMIYADILSGDYVSAKGWSEHALKSFPNDPSLILFQAIAESKLGNHERALELAKRSHELNPTPQSSYIYSSLLNNQPLVIE